MSRITFKWFKLDLGDLPQRVLHGAAKDYMAEAKSAVGISANGADKRARQVRGKIRQRQAVSVKLWEKFRHSLPGEPPRKITGFGEANIQTRPFRAGRSSGYRVGVFQNAVYMAYLDMGVKARGGRSGYLQWRVAPRPWVIPSLRRAIPKMRATIAKYGGRLT